MGFKELKQKYRKISYSNRICSCPRELSVILIFKDRLYGYSGMILVSSDEGWQCGCHIQPRGHQMQRGGVILEIKTEPLKYLVTIIQIQQGIDKLH